MDRNTIVCILVGSIIIASIGIGYAYLDKDEPPVEKTEWEQVAENLTTYGGSFSCNGEYVVVNKGQTVTSTDYALHVGMKYYIISDITGVYINKY